LIVDHRSLCQLLRDLNISDLHISIDRGPDHIFYLPYHMNNISIELEIAAMSDLLPLLALLCQPPSPLISYDAMGDKKLSRNLLFELWNQVEKYRKHGDTLEFDFHLGAKNFKDWYNDHKVRRTVPCREIHLTSLTLSQTFGTFGDLYCSWNNLVFGAEMYRMALEKLLKCRATFFSSHLSSSISSEELE
jgi:hypothetical protein